MNICIDIGHPAHVHYFKNFIKVMERKGHRFLVTARDREQIFYLLDAYHIGFLNRGSGYKTIAGKMFYLVKADVFIYWMARRFKPDLFLSFASPYAAHAAGFMGVPHIAFDDTEHSKFEHMLYAPFTEWICTPECFKKDFGEKHLRFNGYMELCYLHPNYFKPDPSILRLLGVNPGEKFVVMRFISWNAGHDIGHSGMSTVVKRRALQELSKYARVFISSESELPPEFQKYKISIPAQRIHDALFYASLFFGESGTMSTEAALLGTPTVRVSTIAKLLGNYTELRDRYNLIEFFDSGEDGLEMSLRLLRYNVKSTWREKCHQMLKEKIDVTQFMIDLVSEFN